MLPLRHGGQSSTRKGEEDFECGQVTSQLLLMKGCFVYLRFSASIARRNSTIHNVGILCDFSTKRTVHGGEFSAAPILKVDPSAHTCTAQHEYIELHSEHM